MASPDVRTAADLKNKTVILAFQKDLTSVVWNRWLQARAWDHPTWTKFTIDPPPTVLQPSQASACRRRCSANPGIRVGQLADFVGLEISALSHLLRRMTRSHLVRRARSEDDQRAIAVTLTPEGDSMAQQCLAISRRHEALMLQEVAPETRKFPRHLLRRLLANVGKALPGAANQSLNTGARAAEPERPPAASRRMNLNQQQERPEG